MCISISATVALGCLFSPKVYLVLFQPYKNVRPGASICGGGAGAAGAGGGGNSSNNNHPQKFSQTSKFRNKGKQKSSLYLESSGGCATTGPASSTGGGCAPAAISMDSLAQQQPQPLALTQKAADLGNDASSTSTDGAPAPLSPLSPILNGNGETRGEELSVIATATGAK